MLLPLITVLFWEIFSCHWEGTGLGVLESRVSLQKYCHLKVLFDYSLVSHKFVVFNNRKNKIVAPFFTQCHPKLSTLKFPISPCSHMKLLYTALLNSNIDISSLPSICQITQEALYPCRLFSVRDEGTEGPWGWSRRPPAPQPWVLTSSTYFHRQCCEHSDGPLGRQAEWPGCRTGLLLWIPLEILHSLWRKRRPRNV